MSARQRILFLVPPVRLNRHEYEYLVHWPRHALALGAELGSQHELAILDITAEFHRAGGWGGRSFRAVMVSLIQERVAAFRPTLVAVHAHAAPHVPIVAHCLKVLQGCKGDFITVVGGMAASHLPDVLAPHIAPGGWIIRGEVSGRARQLFEIVTGKGAAPADCTISEDNRGVRALTLAAPAHDVDYPLPSFEALPMDVYEALFKSRDFVPHMETSLGCSYRCTFCSVHYPGARGTFRRRSLERVVEELRYLREHHGFDEFYFCDETFTLDRENAAALCKAIAAEVPGIRWRCVTRVDAIDEEIVGLMAAAGCYEIGFGIEAGSDTTLKQIAKRASTDRAVQAIELVQRHGITANALLIIGLPHEDHRDIRRTFDYIAKVAQPKRCQIFVFHPVPGTVYFDQPGRFGLTLPALEKLDNWYLFDHIGEPVCDTRHLSREDVARYYLLFNQAFSSIADPEPDNTLIDRVLKNRFPTRRRGTTWVRDDHRIRIYRPRDPAASVSQNAFIVEPEDASGDSGKRLDVLGLILSLADGNRTRGELRSLVSALAGLDEATACSWTDEYLSILEKADVIADF